MMRPEEILLITQPGLEPLLEAEARELGFQPQATSKGAVGIAGAWPEVWRANLMLRGATRVLVRIGAFRAFHLAQLDKRARKFPWQEWLPKSARLRLDVSTRASKIYHAGAAAQRIEGALATALGATVDAEASLRLHVRIEDNLCTFSIDTSGAPLHQRGHKQAVGKAPLRESLAAALLRHARYRAGEPLVDPMCGSGTFVLEAAEMTLGLFPGRSRTFAFEQLPGFDVDEWDAMRSLSGKPAGEARFYGSDRDQGVVRSATANAERAGVDAVCAFQCHAVSDLQRPAGPPGLVMVNPPYGGRVGNKKLLFALYGALGKTLKEWFSDWRVGLLTSEASLAQTTGLPFGSEPLALMNGGLKVRFYQTGELS
ncbi:MAG: class I SAM-dependent RNA methyltransferase [Pseudomonadota bacterium]